MTSDEQPPQRLERADLKRLSRRGQIWQGGIAMLAVMGFAAAMAFGALGLSTQSDLDAAKKRSVARGSSISQLAAGQSQLASALDQQRSQFQTCVQQKGHKLPASCRTPIAPPASKIASVAVTVGPSDGQVQRAVDLYCAIYGCQEGPTQAQVAAAVAAYCDANGKCRGPAGASATPIPGSPGASGAVGATGAQGPPPSDAQVAAAVNAYCATHDDCRGPGGGDGRDGKDGRGITDVTCTDDGRFQFTYTDGSTQVVGDTNTCRHGGIVPTP